MKATRKVKLIGVRQDERMGPGGGCCWAHLQWDDGDYGYHHIHMEVTEEEAIDLGPHLFKDFNITLSLADD